MILQEEREKVVEIGRKLVELGITVGTYGNVSMYNPKENLMAMSPSGLDYMDTEPEDIVILTPEGEKVDGDRKPSSEYDLHRIFYLKRPGINGIVHTHSTYATTLACLRWSIEPIHYIIGYAGYDVPCTDYLTFGTMELAEEAFKVMGDRNAVLLGNHGDLCVGPDLDFALDVAQEIEFLSQIYYNCRVAGGAVNLTKEDVKHMRDMVESYHQKK